MRPAPSRGGCFGRPQLAPHRGLSGAAALGGELGPGCGQEPPGSTRLTSGPSARTSLSVGNGGRVSGGGREKAA